MDQRIGFLGGLDICYGRFDTSGHRINENNPDYYPGIEYNNIRLADFVNVKEHNVDSVPRDRPRLPWHDVAIKLEGDVVLDIVNHFIEYWNYANFQSQNEKRYVLIMDSANTELTLKEKMKRRLENISIFKAIKKIK